MRVDIKEFSPEERIDALKKLLASDGWRLVTNDLNQRHLRMVSAALEGLIKGDKDIRCVSAVAGAALEYSVLAHIPLVLIEEAKKEMKEREEAEGARTTEQSDPNNEL